LQSKLNEDVAPALYLCPNNHLLEQTVSQARQFGIRCATAAGDLPSEFLESRQIIESWQREYNESRPYRALGENTPSKFACRVEASRDPTGPEEAEELALEVV
jgi:transposase InsO family protein